jgi:DnaJ homolog subfamily C member 2
MVILNEDQYQSLSLSSFITLDFEPVGKWFDFYNYRKHQGDVQIEEDEIESSESSEEENEEQINKYLSFLQTLDPRDWKNQDHYKVLGIENLRYKATQNQIKKARKLNIIIKLFLKKILPFFCFFFQR